MGKYIVLRSRDGELMSSDLGGPDEHFVLMLKDRYAHEALLAYAIAAHQDDPEYADEVHQLAMRAGRYHPLCKRPD
jgi:hypothetical protein